MVPLCAIYRGDKRSSRLRRRSRLDQSLEGSGNELIQPHAKALGGGLFELRGKQVRIFYLFRPGHRIVLLGAMIKKRREIPSEVLRQLYRLNKQID